MFCLTKNPFIKFYPQKSLIKNPVYKQLFLKLKTENSKSLLYKERKCIQVQRSHKTQKNGIFNYTAQLL